MSWLQRVFSVMGQSALQPAVSGSHHQTLDAAIPGLDWSYAPRKDVIDPRFPIEYMGIQGEYDPQGLAKRVAYAFDQHAEIKQIDTLCIIQHGSKISLLGKVNDQASLGKLIVLAKQVSGTQDVDVNQVVVSAEALTLQS